mgnify:CR=1 FL=1
MQMRVAVLEEAVEGPGAWLGALRSRFHALLGRGRHSRQRCACWGRACAGPKLDPHHAPLERLHFFLNFLMRVRAISGFWGVRYSLNPRSWAVISEVVGQELWSGR